MALFLPQRWRSWSTAQGEVEPYWDHEVFSLFPGNDAAIFIPRQGVYSLNQAIDSPFVPALTDGSGAPGYRGFTSSTAVVSQPAGVGLQLETIAATGRFGFGTTIRARYCMVLTRGTTVRTSDGNNAVYYGYAVVGDGSVDFGNGSGNASSNRRSWTWTAPRHALAIRPNSTMANAATVYTDGTSTSVSANGGTATSYNWGNSTTTWQAGRNIANGTYISQAVGFFIAIEGALPDHWLAELSAHPYQVLRKRTARLYTFPPVAAVGTSKAVFYHHRVMQGMS